MLKKTILILAYTIFIAVVSALITTAYFHYFILNNNSAVQQDALISLSAEQIANSPIKDNNSIIEIFSYGCHYCAVNEKNVSKLEKRLPAGKKLIRLHMSLDDMGGLSRYAPFFATLSVMGIEETHRVNVYNAVVKNDIDLGNSALRNQWLQENGIDVDEYNKISKSKAVTELISYMTSVTNYYNINATPTFIVSKKWVALQDRDFSAFSDQLLSLLENDKLLEP